jgi:hypothetical protein
VAKVLLHAINPALPSNKQLGSAQLQNLLDALRMQIEQNMQQFTTITYLYTYRSLSDTELQQYISHYESPAGQWVANTTYEAVMAALGDAIRQFKASA